MSLASPTPTPRIHSSTHPNPRHLPADPGGDLEVAADLVEGADKHPDEERVQVPVVADFGGGGVAFVAGTTHGGILLGRVLPPAPAPAPPLTVILLPPLPQEEMDVDDEPQTQEATVYACDIRDRDNPDMVVEYIDELYKYYKECEVSRRRNDEPPLASGGGAPPLPSAPAR